MSTQPNKFLLFTFILYHCVFSIPSFGQEIDASNDSYRTKLKFSGAGFLQQNMSNNSSSNEAGGGGELSFIRNIELDRDDNDKLRLYLGIGVLGLTGNDDINSPARLRPLPTVGLSYSGVRSSDERIPLICSGFNSYSDVPIGNNSTKFAFDYRPALISSNPVSIRFFEVGRGGVGFKKGNHKLLFEVNPFSIYTDTSTMQHISAANSNVKSTPYSMRGYHSGAGIRYHGESSDKFLTADLEASGGLIYGMSAKREPENNLDENGTSNIVQDEFGYAAELAGEFGFQVTRRFKLTVGGAINVVAYDTVQNKLDQDEATKASVTVFTERLNIGGEVLF